MNSQERWNIEIDPSVLKTIKKFPNQDKEKIRDVICDLPIKPFVGDIQKLSDMDSSWRRRVGNYRIFFKLKTDKKVILVFHAERRTSTTYRRRG